MGHIGFSIASVIRTTALRPPSGAKFLFNSGGRPTPKQAAPGVVPGAIGQKPVDSLRFSIL